MLRLRLILSSGLLCGLLQAQQALSPENKKLIEAARSRYYSPLDHGLTSFSCNVHFDLSTIPTQLLPEAAVADRKLLTEVDLKIEVGSAYPPYVRHKFPVGTNPVAEQQLGTVIQWMSSITQGFFQTWPSKALHGPIPPFTAWVDSISSTPTGYLVKARSADGLQSIESNKELLVTRIVSVAGDVIERPSFQDSPDGLVYSGTDTLQGPPGADQVHVQYEIENALMDGFRLPARVHLRVVPNVDVRFAMDRCSVKKADAITVAPSISGAQPR